jgi:hypothetical protein
MLLVKRLENQMILKSFGASKLKNLNVIAKAKAQLFFLKQHYQ